MAFVLLRGLKTEWLRFCLILLLAETLLGNIKAPVYQEHDFISNVPDSPHFVMFFAPWCSHCERLSPLWDILANHFEMKGAPVVVAKVDCTTDTHLCAQENIKAYPTLKFFNNGQKATYRGSRDVSEFIEFSNKQTFNEGTVQESADELVMELDTYRFEKEIQEGLKIVNFYAPWCSHCKKLAPTWQQLSKEFQYSLDVRILKVDCEKEKLLCKKYEITGFPSIIAFSNGLWKGKHEGGRAIENLREFVEKMIKDHNTEMKGEEEKTHEIDETKDQSHQSTDEYLPSDHSHEVINIGKDIFDMTVQSGKTFVYFFAPWCKYCKQFTPVWNELAASVFNEGIMVKIAKVDCTKEIILCRELKISQYPSLLLFKSRLSFEQYTGSRDLKSLLQFLKQREHDEL